LTGILVMLDAAGIAYFEEGAGMDKTESAAIEMSDAPARAERAR
jgi:hypothetical protein